MRHTLHDIAVFFDASAPGQKILAAAAHLASRHGAHLIGITAIAQNDFLSPGACGQDSNLRETVRWQQDVVTARLLHAGQSLARTAARHRISGEFRIVPLGEDDDETAAHLQYCDLLVTGKPVAGAPPAWSVPHMLDNTRVPMLVIPGGWNGSVVGLRIIVACHACRATQRGLASAMPLLRAAEVVDVLVVAPESHEDQGGEPGESLSAYLARHRVPVTARGVASQGSDVAQVILLQAAERGADLIICNPCHGLQTSDAAPDGVIRKLLDAGQVPLLVSR